MDVREAPVSDNPYTKALVLSPVWAGNALTYSFPTTAAQFTGYSGGEPATAFEMLNSVQQAAVDAIFASIASFTNLTFTKLIADPASAVLRFGMTDDTETAHAYLPSASELGGDAWFRNTGGEYDNPVRGNYAWFTFAHEIGHALGLGHPHEAEPAMPQARDSMQYTVMSYRSFEYDDIQGYTNDTWGFSQTYMVEDIAALQFLYGANFNYNSGGNLYQWSPTTGELFIDGVGQGAAGGNVIFQTIWDGGGIDTFDLSNYVIDTSVFYNPTVIDLRPGEGSFLQGQHADLGTGPFAYNFFTARLYNGDTRSLIENAVGTNGRDVIRGNEAANHLDGRGAAGGSDELYGFGGDDVLVGGGFLIGGDGNDTLSGGGSLYGGTGNDWLYGADDLDWLEGNEGDDTLFAAGGNDGLKGHSGHDTLYGEAGNDILEGGDDADDLYGGVGADELYGGAGDDSLIGAEGNDKLEGGLGNDVLAGGLGDDFYVIEDGSDQIVELAGEGTDKVQTLVSFVLPDGIENLEANPYPWNALPINLTGNSLDNVLSGNSAANVLDGGAGADSMGGGFGDDTYYVDHADDLVYEVEGAGIDVIYASTSYTLRETPPPPPPLPGYDPYAGASLRGNDWYTGENQIERLVLTGSASLSATGNKSANTLDGNSGGNALSGLAGNDTLNGAAGDDTLTGGAGDDSLDGGANFDIAVYTGNRADYTITTQGGVTQVTGPDGTDTLTNVEKLLFADSVQFLTIATSVLDPYLSAFGSLPEAGGWSDEGTYPRLVADVDGNGRADVVGFGSAGVYVSLTTAAGAAGTPYLAIGGFGAGPEGGGWSDTETYPRLFADIDGDGRDDLIGFGSAGVHAALSTPSGFGATFLAAQGFGAGPEGGGWSDSGTYPRLFADIDGDGLADLVGFGSGGVHAALGTGGGQFGPAFLATGGFGAGAEGGGWSDTETYPRLLADVNGDGMDDIVGFGSGGVHVALAVGGGSFGSAFLAASGFGAGPEGGGWESQELYKRVLADINGDGRADIIGFGSPGTFAALGQADGTFGPAYLAFGGFGREAGWTSDDQYYRTLADIDGDGDADLVGFGDSGVHFARGDGHGGFAQAELAIATFGASQDAGNWASQEFAPRLFADLNGDGAADIVGFGGAGVYAALSGADWPLV